eukprot:CAMPEP_0185758366 /NCGR_PEP_ID=MMETSP1174-20130828/17017_1 /TAXON_ID=35687 /ORGANISM="Dictyocha speculum, Strain CCMP1381" /LENGTH=48 /DNA_ID= /DNA_START= /DNA_END= /DNA_ORIENTATION=
MALGALDVIHLTMLTEPMAAEHGIDMGNWDTRATKVVTGYDRVMSLQV